MKKLLSTALVAAGLTVAIPAPQANAQEPFLGQMTWFAGNFAPRGWAFCDGQILPINQNQSLYSLLGTTYGGDGRTTFALPDVRGRTPIHRGQGPVFNYNLGNRGGAETVVLNATQIPSHGHAGAVKATTQAADGTSPDSASFAESTQEMYFEGNASLDATLANGSAVVRNAGGSQAHNNMQPYGTLNCLIALQGLFPSRN